MRKSCPCRARWSRSPESVPTISGIRTQEDKAVIHMCNMGFLHIQRELQFAFEEFTTCFAHCLGMFASPLDHDHKVICIPTVGYSRFPLPVFSYSNGPLLENAEVPRPPIFAHLLVQVVPFHPRIKFMQHDVGQQG